MLYVIKQTYEEYMLKVININYSVKENNTQKQILKNISFEISNNQNLVITGHNGSGKSTLLKIIMGIIKPTSGKIIFNDVDVTNLPITDRANLGIAFAFQTPVCFKGLTIKKLLELSGEKQAQNISYHCDILSKLGLCAREYLDREMSNKLSGGEQKRVEIASVLARNAKLNLFDEPEAGIDIWSFDNLVKIFKTNNSTNIIVSHQKKLIEKADNILLLNEGTITAFGKTSDILPLLNDKVSCDKIRSENGQN